MPPLLPKPQWMTCTLARVVAVRKRILVDGDRPPLPPPLSIQHTSVRAHVGSRNWSPIEMQRLSLMHPRVQKEAGTPPRAQNY